MRWVAQLALRSVFVAVFLAAGCHGCEPGPTRCTSAFDCPDDGSFCSVPACVAGACTVATSPCVPGQVCDEAERRCLWPDDGGMPDGAASCDPLGAACLGPDQCGGFVCQTEGLAESVSTVRTDGSPGRPLPVPVFPGGYCAPTCDATLLNDPCGPCAKCNDATLAGAVRLPGDSAVCRARCTPSPTSSGCARAGYTCDLETSTCMEGCVDDRQCQIGYQDLVDSYELIDRGSGDPAYCDPVTRRCRMHGAPGAHIGDPCSADSQCPDDGHCLRQPSATQGICTRLGCRAPGFGCDGGTRCDEHNVGYGQSGCLVSCRVGAEEGTDAVRGSRTGGNPDCGPGLACVWNGVSERGDPRAGSCLPGVYNDRTTPNIGDPCHSDDDCDSPYGYGVCLFSNESGLSSGICSVQNCGTFLDDSGAQVDGLLPGVQLASPICDPGRGEVCLSLGDQRVAAQTYCLKRCDDASGCAPGYACTQPAHRPRPLLLARLLRRRGLPRRRDLSDPGRRPVHVLVRYLHLLGRGGAMRPSVALLLSLAALGCGAKTGLLLPDASAPADAARPMDAPPDAPPRLDASCPDLPVALRRTDVETIFLLDGSGSMGWTWDGQPFGAGLPSRWMIVHDTLASVLPPVDRRLAIGAKIFPDSGACDVYSGLDVAPHVGGTGAVLALFDHWHPEGGTPTAVALLQTLAAPSDAPRVVVVTTDGAPNCNEDPGVPPDECVCTGPRRDCLAPPPDGPEQCLDAAATLSVVREAYAGGTPVVVVGIDDPTRPDLSDFLDEMAIAGGWPRPVGEGRRFYSARAPGDLGAAFTQITALVSRCVFSVASPPPADATVVVRVDGTVVPPDPTHADGWDWTDRGRGALTFFGASCDALGTGDPHVTARVMCTE